MENSREKKVEIIDDWLEFYFPNGILSSGKISEDELNAWLSTAYLYDISSREALLQDKEKYEYFSLIEDLYITAEVEWSPTDKLCSVQLADIGEGFDYNREKYANLLERAFKVLNEFGTDLREDALARHASQA